MKEVKLDVSELTEAIKELDGVTDQPEDGSYWMKGRKQAQV